MRESDVKLIEDIYFRLTKQPLKLSDLFRHIIWYCGVDADLSEDELLQFAVGEYRGNMRAVGDMSGVYLMSFEIAAEKYPTPINVCGCIFSMFMLRDALHVKDAAYWNFNFRHLINCFALLLNDVITEYDTIDIFLRVFDFESLKEHLKDDIPDKY